MAGIDRVVPLAARSGHRLMLFSAFDLSSYSDLLAALAYSLLGLRLLQSRSLASASARSSWSFVIAVVSSALWGWAALAESISNFPILIVRLFDLVRYAGWFAFLLSLLAPVITQRRERVIVLLVPAAGLLVLFAFVAALLQGAVPRGTSENSAAMFATLALPVFGLILVEQLFRNVAENSRWNAKPLCLGLSVMLFYDLYAYSQALLFRGTDSETISIRGAIHALVVPLLFVASRRRSDWIARLQISRVAAFHSAALALAGIYLLIVAAIGYYIRYFGGAWGAALQLVALISALTMLGALAVSGTMRSRLRVWVGKHFFSYRYDYREEWLRFTAMLSEKNSSSEMGTLMIRGMADMVESPAGALWTPAPGNLDFVQVVRWNAPAQLEREPIASAFSQALLTKGWVVDLEQCRIRHAQQNGPMPPSWLLESRHVWLVVPLIVADELVGFITLDQARTAVDLDWEVTDLLKTASRQAAGILAQMRATEALLEARKFDAFNRMSAFVVHDLKNIVTQLSLMMKNAKRLHDNPEFQRDMLETVESSLEKMRRLMLQLREGEAPPGGQSGVELLPIVRRVEAMATERGRDVEVRIVDPVVTRGHEERIERVIGHVVQNALDATQPSDRVWLELGRRSGYARIEVGDTGSGMSQEYLQTRLFKPFQTTKQSGMGIGAYESLQYVRELGGNISVDTEEGRGTVMTILLPLFDTRPASDLQMSSLQS